MLLGEKKVKKQLSTLLAVVLFFSFLTPVFADNGEGEEETIFDEFTEQELKDNDYILYFVNAGDPTPDTVEGIDKFGLYASVTEQEYKEDPVTGKMWGLTTTTSASSVRDPSNKLGTLRYYNGPQVRDKALAYDFELPEGEYDITFGFKNPWSGARSLCLMAEGQKLSQEDFPIGRDGEEKEITFRRIPVSDGMLNVRVQGPSTGEIHQHNDPLVNYIIIRLSVTLQVSDIEERIEQAKTEASNTAYTPYSREELNKAIADAEKLVQSINNNEKNIDDDETQI
ncbi:MAG: hypothetical protein GX892_15245, partial [Thermoanaerobacteraceae bacterium]|nr:hypothetical protein [Thermoanaerobacteraceae bacterium]